MKPTFRQALYGLAVADAIGNPLEFQSKVSAENFQESAEAKVLRISDDTQMALFCAEGLIQGYSTAASYKRWYKTQSSFPNESSPDGLLRFKDLYHREAPGVTCTRSCMQLIANRPVQNDSKGNGGLMRLLPIPYFAKTPEQTWDRAVEDTRTTHKHPLAIPCSGMLSLLHYRLIQGVSWNDALQEVLNHKNAKEVWSIVESVLQSHAHYTEARKTWRGGVAEEALALAVGAVHYNRDKGYMRVIEDAICIPGDSDTVGAIAGGLAVSAHMGYPPDDYCKKLNALSAIDWVVDQWEDTFRSSAISS